ncbi:MAG: SWIM zinc finger family protein [Microthrixaceae bacterium]
MIDPGRVRSRVSGSHGRHYVTEVEVRRIPDAAWDPVVDVLASKSAHAAALADGELDPAIVADVRAAGVELLPGPGDLRPHCTCPDWAEPCKHAAAVCYLVAAELDRDPFLLFLLRGLPCEALVAMMAERRRGGAGGAGDAVRGVVAATAWAGWTLDGREDVAEADADAALPRALARHIATPAHPGRPAPWEARIAPGDPVDPRRVDELAEDATDRAWLMLADAAPSGLAASVWGDLARRAGAAHPRETRDAGHQDPSRHVHAQRVGCRVGTRRRSRCPGRGRRGLLVDRPVPLGGRSRPARRDGVPQTIGRTQLRQPRHAEGGQDRGRARRSLVPPAVPQWSSRHPRPGAPRRGTVRRHR